MKFEIKSLMLIILLALASNLQAQISQGGLPYSFTNKTADIVPNVKMANFDITEMLKEDGQNIGKPVPYRFGKVFDVNLNPQNSGIFQILENGDKLWQLEISSEKAYSIGLLFGKYKLPKGAKLFIYSSDKENIAGAFTSKNNKSFEKLAIGQVPTDKIVIEYFEPANSEFSGKLEITKVIHDYKDEISKSGLIGDCHVNVSCPQGIGWENEIQSVCKMMFLGFACSGAMINNTAENSRPYFLTARHCVSSEEQAEAMVFVFNFQSEFCWRNFGSQAQKLSGSHIVATSKNDEIDFTLLEMSEVPPTEYKPFFAGWNSTKEPADSTTGIHHPGGDVKKITIDKDPPTVGTVNAVGFRFAPLSHWKLLQIDTGFYEPGSSGGPLFNQDREIVGDLSAVTYDHCDYPFNVYFSKFDEAWDRNDDPTQQLKFWLDPLNTGKTKMSGKIPEKFNLDILPVSISNVQDIYCENSAKLDPVVHIKNIGTQTVNNFFLTVFLNGIQVQSLRYEGVIESGDNIEITLNRISLTAGQNKIEITSSNPNGKQDENPSNDVLFFFPDLKENHIKANLKFTSQQLGRNCAWWLTDSQNNILYKGGTYAMYGAIDINENFCLADECFNFKIESFLSGSYSLTNISTGEIIASAVNLEKAQETYFCANSIIDVNTGEIKFSPNPSNGKFIIETQIQQSKYVEISDISGKIIYKKDYNPQNEIDISAYKNGVYTVKIYTDKNVFFGKIILNH